MSDDGTFRTCSDDPIKSVVRCIADKSCIPRASISPLAPHIKLMTKWQPPKREPAKTKDQLRDMLAEAVRNTQAENNACNDKENSRRKGHLKR